MGLCFFKRTLKFFEGSIEIFMNGIYDNWDFLNIIGRGLHGDTGTIGLTIN